MEERVEQREEGFSLVELMTVVMILGVLVAIVIASYTATVTHCRRIACLENQRILESAATVHVLELGSDPTDIEDLRPYVKNLDLVIECPADPSTHLYWDPAAGEAVCDNHP